MAFRVFENGKRCNDYGIENWKTDTHSTLEGAILYAYVWAFPISIEHILNSDMITPMKLGVEEDFTLHHDYPMMMKVEEVEEECELTSLDKKMIEWQEQNPHINLNTLNECAFENCDHQATRNVTIEPEDYDLYGEKLVDGKIRMCNCCFRTWENDERHR